MYDIIKHQTIQGKTTIVIFDYPHIRQNTDLLVKWCYQIQGGQFYIHYT